MHYVYVLENQHDRSFYIGYTDNLRRRILEHQNSQGGRTTRIKKGWKLIYYEAYLSRDDALGRERFLKSGSGHRYLHKQLVHYLNSR